MTGERMWQAFCLATNTDQNTRHDIWKFCGGGVFADELAKRVLAGTKTATSSVKLAYEWRGRLYRLWEHTASFFWIMTRRPV